MNKVFALVAFMAVLALAACGGTGVGGGDDDGNGGDTGGGGDKMDGSQGTIDMYVNGTIEASYWIQVHADPKPGQYWETGSEAYGNVMTYRWQVAVVDGSTAVIEQQSKMDSEYMVSDYVIAYEVNLDAGEGEANVTKAWIGKPGEKPAEIKVMAKPEPTCGGCGTTDYEMTEEDFSGVELGGGTWSGKLVTIKGDGWESKSWTATDGWFGGLIKTEAGGMVTELKAFGDDATPLLDW